MKKLDKLYKEIVQDEVNVFNELSTTSNDIRNFMKKFGIGYKVKTFKQETGAVKKLRDLLQQTLMKDKETSPTQLEEEIKDEVLKSDTSLTDYEVERVARTEVKSMQIATKLLRWKEMGVKKVRWKTNISKNSGREDILMNNKIIDINEAISDPDKRPPLHPNCRCTFLVEE